MLAYVRNSTIRTPERFMVTPTALDIQRHAARPALAFTDPVQPSDEDRPSVIRHKRFNILVLEPVRLIVLFQRVVIGLPFLFRSILAP